MKKRPKSMRYKKPFRYHQGKPVFKDDISHNIVLRR